ncbi:MAG: YraN family protein [Lachnospiraceae bacterium]|nr:YraN family protein [Lachnospiraceae bacterium]
MAETDNTREKGAREEELAAGFLEKNGARILERNFRNRRGEIDIIALEGDDTLLFIEVKYRKSDMRGLPAEAVNYKKQKTICRVADFYRAKNDLDESFKYRFDVISITDKGITHFKNAFSYIPR